MDKGLELKDIKNLFSRRKKGFWVVFMTIFLGGFIVAIALPPVYRSEAIIRVEEQEIPEDFVQSTISEYVDERITKISQQVLNRERLFAIADRNNLYSDGKSKKNETEIVRKMKKDIALVPIFSELQNQLRGRPRSAVTIAFNLSYQGKDPIIIQKVTDTLSRLFLEEDVKRRERVVSTTNEFLKAEQHRLREEIKGWENEISKFKKAHLHELPDEQRYNFQAILRLERELDQNQNQLRLKQEKEMLLNTQLAKVEPLTPIVVEGSNVSSNPNQRLKELYLQLTQFRSIYSEKHPDIKKIKNEINELETQVKHSDVSVEKIKRLNQLEEQLAEKQGVYGPEHPEIKAIKREIAILKPEVDGLMTEAVKIKISEERPDNPAYINLVTQIKAIKMEMEALRVDNKKILQDIDKFQRRIEKAPFVEKELNELLRDREGSQAKYRDISNKFLDARVAGTLEGKQQADRVSIASPAYLPSKPFKPNRLLILMLSFASALIFSSFFVAFREGMDHTVKNSDQIKSITGIPVLSSVSYIVTTEERRSNRYKKFIWSLAVFLVLGVLLIVVDQFIISFDNLLLKFNQIWTIILERIKMIA
jgi:uncharacterized protein involved in exopolysaccharide biosynthesis